MEVNKPNKILYERHIKGLCSAISYKSISNPLHYVGVIFTQNNSNPFIKKFTQKRIFLVLWSILLLKYKSNKVGGRQNNEIGLGKKYKGSVGIYKNSKSDTKKVLVRHQIRCNIWYDTKRCNS